MSISTIKTTRTSDFLTISIPINEMKPEDVENILAFIKSGIITQKSKMTEADAEEISEEIKSAWWEKNKSKIEKMMSEDD